MKLFIFLGIMAILTMAFSPPVDAHVLKKDTSPTEWINVLKEHSKTQYLPFVNNGLDPFTESRMVLIQPGTVLVDRNYIAAAIILCRLMRSDRKDNLYIQKNHSYRWQPKELLWCDGYSGSEFLPLRE